MPHPNQEYWWDLKDRVKVRCLQRCELCIIRWGYALHHSTYISYGHEKDNEVMLLCSLCHDFVHHFRKKVTAAPISLALSGDSGHGWNAAWKFWLENSKEIVQQHLYGKMHDEELLIIPVLFKEGGKPSHG